MAAPAAARMAAIKRMVFKIPKMEKPELSSVSGSAFKAGSPAGSPVMGAGAVKDFFIFSAVSGSGGGFPVAA